MLAVVIIIIIIITAPQATAIALLRILAPDTVAVRLGTRAAARLLD